jgi:hypothetical protein
MDARAWTRRGGKSFLSIPFRYLIFKIGNLIVLLEKLATGSG